MNWASIGPFLECWLKDTLPNARIEMLYALRLDGDMCGRTIAALDALYHKVSLDGFVIVENYVLRPCAEAVDEFSAQSRIRALLPGPDETVVW
jgi:O-methyltransferase